MSEKNHSGNLPPKSTKPKNETIVNSLLSATLVGLSANKIEVEATFTKGLPGFSVVGLVSSDIQ
ncbi:MAG TPA: ATP-binding protein, partial [Sulfurovum sp.]|nr:ATP-binding protein [Sulfurovum sp.]